MLDRIAVEARNASPAPVVVRPLLPLTPAHVDDLVELYSGAWWTETRNPDEVRMMLDHTPDIVAIEDRSGSRLVAFARVVTDRICIGTLLDVIVRRDLRGRGLGDLVMKSVIELPSLSRLRVITLNCREGKIPFYERWGFEVRSWLPPDGELGRGAAMRRKHAGSAAEHPSSDHDGYRIEP